MEPKAKSKTHSPGATTFAKLRALRDSTLDHESWGLCVAVGLRENGDTGETYASVRVLAADAKLSRATVFRRLVKLIRQGVITQKPRNGRTSLLSLNLAAIERFRRVEQGGTNPSPKPQSTERPRPLENLNDFPQPIFEKLLQYFPRTSPERLAWAVHLVRSRAKTAPRTLAYFRRALPRVFENLAAEVPAWLTQFALRRLREDGDGLRLPDLAEELKLSAARCDLPYSSEAVCNVIDAALRSLENDRRVETELRVGAFSG